MRTEQTKKEMQAKENVVMTVEDLTVIMELIDRGIMYYDDHYFRNRYCKVDEVKMSTGHDKTEFKLNRKQLFEVVIKFQRQFMDAVLFNVEDVVF